MVKKITIMDARKMSKGEIESQLKDATKVLENGLGIDHECACTFLSNVMNLGIASQEKFNQMKQE